MAPFSTESSLLAPVSVASTNAAAGVTSQMPLGFQKKKRNLNEESFRIWMYPASDRTIPGSTQVC